MPELPDVEIFRRLVDELNARSLRNFLQVEAVPRQRALRVGA